MRWLLLLLACASLQAQTELTGKEIMRRSMERDAGRWSDLKDYTFHEFVTQKRLDKQGTVTSTETQLNEVLILGARPYNRTLEKDGKPLPEKEARKEQEKLDKEAAKRAKETDRDRAKLEKDRLEAREKLKEVVEAFDFTLLGEEHIDGLAAWKIHAEPKPGYKPREDLFKKVRGNLWIEQTDYQWVRGEIDVIDTISFGWFVLRIPAGARIEFDQMRVNDEVWVPRHAHMRANAKLALLKTFRVNVDVEYRNYRKFRTESQVIGVEESPAQPN